MSALDLEIESLVAAAGGLLTTSSRRVVFAESCTAGLVSAMLSTRPGISNQLCGSAVTYRDATKTKWLGVPADVLTRCTAVSDSVAALMAVGVLVNTPEADLAVSVTGHLGPNAPPEQDGLVYVGSAVRSLADGSVHGRPTCQHRLSEIGRLARQREAVVFVLRRLLAELEPARQNP